MPNAQRFPMDIPFGWFFVGYSDELAAGEVRPLHYFGRDLVMFRNAAGEAAVLDAHCPHLGAHLGHGGTVDGASIRCPFHGWAYRPDGFCSDVPYAKTMPPITRRQPIIRSYPVTEANGVIWAWYHPADAAPMFEVAVYPEFTRLGWAKQTRFVWRCATTPQEVAENGIDVAHFQFVHSAQETPEGASTYDRHMRRTGSDARREIVLPDGERKIIETSTRTVQNGAGQKVTILKGIAPVALMVLVTPIEADDAEIRFCMTHPEVEPDSQDDMAIRHGISIIVGQTGVAGDLPIWNNKIYQARPLLCDGDGQILRFRQYFAQFYIPAREPERVAAE